MYIIFIYYIYILNQEWIAVYACDLLFFSRKLVVCFSAFSVTTLADQISKKTKRFDHYPAVFFSGIIDADTQSSIKYPQKSHHPLAHKVAVVCTFLLVQRMSVLSSCEGGVEAHS